jgi:tetratricopeptide (TPR) repeat protein
LGFYAIVIKKDYDLGGIIRLVIALAGVIVAFFRPRNIRRAVNKKELYQKSYSEYIQNAFSDNKKLENKLYAAIHDYNCDKPGAGLKKLEKLRKECQRTADLYAVTVFTGLCLDDMGQYEKAAEKYETALHIRPSSSMTSNLGLCWQRLGDTDKALSLYERAIELDSGNAVALNNISALYFRQGDYETALDYAEAALDCNAVMPQALSTAAICSALLGSEEEYKNYYRRAVSAGYDGNKIKNAIKALNPEL